MGGANRGALAPACIGHADALHCSARWTEPVGAEYSIKLLSWGFRSIRANGSTIARYRLSLGRSGRLTVAAIRRASKAERDVLRRNILLNGSDGILGTHTLS